MDLSSSDEDLRLTDRFNYWCELEFPNDPYKYAKRPRWDKYSRSPIIGSFVCWLCKRTPTRWRVIYINGLSTYVCGDDYHQLCMETMGVNYFQKAVE